MSEKIHKKRRNKNSILKILLRPRTIIAIAIVIAVFGVGIGIKTHFFTDGKTTKIGFENIGELATQSATCTSVRVDSKDRSIFGVTIPFTTSKIIYSYDTIIKAGLNFGDIKWNPDESDKNAKKIYVNLPEIRVLSCDVQYDSFKLFQDNESIFSPITMSEHNDSMKELKDQAQKDSINNGLLDNARDNAKAILNVFFGQVYNLDEYEIIYNES